jgi:hypothetical protein
MELIINDLSQYGLLIHGPESPGFKERLSALVASPADLDEDTLRYSIVIENQTAHHVVNITIVWRFSPSKDASFPFTFSQGFGGSASSVFNGASWSRLASGAQYPFTPLAIDLSAPGQEAAGTESGDERMRRRDQMKSRFAESHTVLVEIDGALFSDGVFVGPDTTGRFEDFEIRVRAARDLIAELNQKLDDGEDAFAHAERYASITKEQIEASFPAPQPHVRPHNLDEARALFHNPEKLYAFFKKSEAMAVILRRQRVGEAAAIEWIRASAKNQIPLVKR